MKNRFKIEPECFKHSHGVNECNIGDEVYARCGCDIITLTKENLLALLSGKILETDFNFGEYTLLIKLEDENEQGN